MSQSRNCSGLSAFPQHVSEFMGPAKSERHSTRSASSTVSKRSSMLPPSTLPVRQPTIQFPLRLSPHRKARTRIQLQRRNLTAFQSVELQLKPLLEEQATARMLAGKAPQRRHLSGMLSARM